MEAKKAAKPRFVHGKSRETGEPALAAILG
jgi:hypothetical protein